MVRLFSCEVQIIICLANEYVLTQLKTEHIYRDIKKAKENGLWMDDVIYDIAKAVRL